jgi:hypothetical protein
MVMADTDTRGRPWIKKKDLRDHLTVELDNGFTCHKSGPTVIRKQGDHYYFSCNCGIHYLDGQAEGDHYVGIYASY